MHYLHLTHEDQAPESSQGIDPTATAGTSASTSNAASGPALTAKKGNLPATPDEIAKATWALKHYQNIYNYRRPVLVALCEARGLRTTGPHPTDPNKPWRNLTKEKLSASLEAWVSDPNQNIRVIEDAMLTYLYDTVCRSAY